jgi:alanine dehydrogenase
MDEILVLGETDVRRLLDLDDLAAALADALRAVSDGAASVPHRTGASASGGLLAAMPGYVPGYGLAAKLVSVFPGNAGGALPTHQALVAVFDASNGAPVAVMGGAHLTAARTATTAAVAARAAGHGAPRSLAILGGGVQARAHLSAFAHIFEPPEVRIFSRRPSTLAAEHPGTLAVGSARQAVEGADVVCCCTAATAPVLDEEWVAPGAHVSSVGSGAELPPALLDRARVLVESRATVVAAPPAGAAELQGRDPATLTEVGEVLAGRAQARRSASEVTVFKSTGHAALDVAAAAVVLRRAAAGGAGTGVEV